MSRKWKIIVGGLCGVALLLVGVYFYLMRWDGKYALYGTRYRVQESRFLSASLDQYAQEHGGNYPPMKSGDFWEVVKALTGPLGGDVAHASRVPSLTELYAMTAFTFMDYDTRPDAYTLIEKFGKVPNDKFAFTYIDGLTASDRAILLFYNRSTVAKDLHAYETNGPPIQGRLVVHAGYTEAEFIPEEKFQAELAATKKLVADRKIKNGATAPAAASPTP